MKRNHVWKQKQKTNNLKGLLGNSPGVEEAFKEKWVRVVFFVGRVKCRINGNEEKWFLANNSEVGFDLVFRKQILGLEMLQFLETMGD